MAHAHTGGAVPPRGNSSTLHSTTVTASTVSSAFSPFTTLPLALQKYICAATAASFAEAVTMPLDVMKTRMQLDLTPLQQTTKTTTPNGVPPPVRRGLLATGHHIYTTEGFRRLYLGLAPAMVRQAIVGGIGVGLYPQIKDICVHFQQGLGRKESFLDCVRNFSPTGAADASAKTPIGVPLAFSTKVIAGAISGIIGQIAAAPMCVVKVRLQADARLPVPRYHGMLDALVKIPRQEGVKALWSGIVPSLQRAAFMYGATISTYDHIKHAIVERWYAGDSRAMDFVTVHVAASSVSGLIASLVSTPFDTIKTRIISQAVIPQKRILGLPTVGASAVATNATVNPSGLLYSSTIDCVVKTVRSEGVLAIYKGLVPCYCRLAPWQLTFFVAFEQLSIAMTGQSLR